MQLRIGGDLPATVPGRDTDGPAHQAGDAPRRGRRQSGRREDQHVIAHADAAVAPAIAVEPALRRAAGAHDGIRRRIRLGSRARCRSSAARCPARDCARAPTRRRRSPAPREPMTSPYLRTARARGERRAARTCVRRDALQRHDVARRSPTASETRAPAARSTSAVATSSRGSTTVARSRTPSCRRRMGCHAFPRSFTQPRCPDGPARSIVTPARATALHARRLLAELEQRADVVVRRARAPALLEARQRRACRPAPRRRAPRHLQREPAVLVRELHHEARA